MSMRALLLICCCWIWIQSISAQCGANQSFVQVVILSDNYGLETSWQLTDGGGVSYGGVAPSTYPNNAMTTYSYTFCLPSSSCSRFRIADSYGDGICCGFGQGNYFLIVDGDTLATGGNFGREAITDFNCPQGSVCSNPLPAVINTNYSTIANNGWYLFTPTATGMYSVSTCGSNTCDTKLWIYDNCNHNFDSSNVGTLFYNDNFCGLQAQIDGAMRAGEDYYIRVGGRGNSCGAGVNFIINYNGPVRGCMDTSACNYNPLATVADTCINWGSPACPNGPDLLLRQDVLSSSLQLASYNSTDPCLATEECVTGMGLRDIVRFSTHIENNGNRDYFIGVPSANNPQFTYGNCHNHWHYEGYAQYLLYDMQGNALPIGMKNGFCVLDLVCDNGGTAQYGCGNMGITAGCGDIYDRSLQCQWVDVTDVPDGDYQLVVRVNWDHSPDATGVYEMDYNNNWGQVCINLSRATGSLQMTVQPNCSPYVDCNGTPYGSAVRDCNGVCNGTGTRGDINSSQQRETTDVSGYLQHVTAQDMPATECLDLHRDSILNVYDAALLQRCLNDSSRCSFPTGLYNNIDTVGLSIINVNFLGQDSNGMGFGYIDIGMRNPTNKVTAYQFQLSNFAFRIDSVESLVNPAQYPVQIEYNDSTKMVAALSPVDSAFGRSFSVQPLCRVYFTNTIVCMFGVCIDSIHAVVSDNFQALAHKKESECFQTIATEENIPAAPLMVKVAPNPFNQSSIVSFENMREAVNLQLFDALGALQLEQNNLNSRQYQLQRNQLPSGVYFLKISSSNGQQTVKIVIE